MTLVGWTAGEIAEPAGSPLLVALAGRFTAARVLLAADPESAVVLRGADHADRAVVPRGPASVLGAVADVLAGRYPQAYHLRPLRGTVAFVVDHGETVQVTIALRWWVNDPAMFVRRALESPVTVSDLVGADVRERLHRAFTEAAAKSLDHSGPRPETARWTAHEVVHESRTLVDHGIGYGRGTVDGQPAGAAVEVERVDELAYLRREMEVEQARQQLERVRIDYYRAIIEAGRSEFLALLLARGADVRQVLDLLLPETPADPGRTDEALRGLFAGLGHDEAERLRHRLTEAWSRSEPTNGSAGKHAAAHTDRA